MNQGQISPWGVFDLRVATWALNVVPRLLLKGSEVWALYLYRVYMRYLGGPLF